MISYLLKRPNVEPSSALWYPWISDIHFVPLTTRRFRFPCQKTPATSKNKQMKIIKILLSSFYARIKTEMLIYDFIDTTSFDLCCITKMFLHTKWNWESSEVKLRKRYVVWELWKCLDLFVILCVFSSEQSHLKLTLVTFQFTLWSLSLCCCGSVPTI